MPAIPSELCEVIAGGTRYQFWKEVEVIRDRSAVSEARLVVAEMSDMKSWGSIQLAPGMKAQIKLAGQVAATGKVIARQVAYDGNNHAVRIVIQSWTAELVHGTLDMKPTQNKNQTLSQLANKVCTFYGPIKFILRGNPSGADKVFKRTSVHQGESPIEYITRHCYMRNIHLTDDENGNLVGTREAQQNVALLQEGRNILSADLLWRNDFREQGTSSMGNEVADDETGGKSTANKSTATDPNADTKRTSTHIAPMPSDKQDTQMHADHMSDLNTAQAVSCNITVRGWLNGQGKLWSTFVGQHISVYSPMLFPQKNVVLLIDSVTHKQSDGVGTVTTLGLTIDRGAGITGTETMAPDVPEKAK